MGWASGRRRERPDPGLGSVVITLREDAATRRIPFAIGVYVSDDPALAGPMDRDAWRSSVERGTIRPPDVGVAIEFQDRAGERTARALVAPSGADRFVCEYEDAGSRTSEERDEPVLQALLPPATFRARLEAEGYVDVLAEIGEGGKGEGSTGEVVVLVRDHER